MAFIDSYTFLIDGKTYEFTNPDVERNNNSTIWEWSYPVYMAMQSLMKSLCVLSTRKKQKSDSTGINTIRIMLSRNLL